MAEIKKGDLVFHRSTTEFKMVVMENTLYGSEANPKTLSGTKNPDRFFCKYYNKYTNEWEEKPFYNYELEPVS
ncbi:hypothetical protein SGQ44_18265 [Flavobacterium sp. Fl-77]|uniref:Uncharacterized protein n=1 Tax=Flavobacterium flavipigmentatum TaxID=2893884 RepID=A0AAJ2SHZ9_9FLAO|nr:MULTISPECIES: hypothetical protein [unclassified Flavobacterium]MDX6181933.1 hypothetical protein [Flavobacterium sp. Fl-33]MDX6187700.1 hypothetical protein [Flavobacterium sp. Fl-77]UFH37144.1 hypothetical protein LNP22_10395 [Flavobacterium sp. F-70]